MPIHDWTRVDAGIFHDLHLSWVSELSKALNSGLLPRDFYALSEELGGRIAPGERSTDPPNWMLGGVSADLPNMRTIHDDPPLTRFHTQAEAFAYARRRRTLVVRHADDHRATALVEMLAPGEKASRWWMRRFLDRAVSALVHGMHVLVIDLHLPGPHDPNGIHAALWSELTDELVSSSSSQPLTVAAYAAGSVVCAYVEPTAVGEPLSDMPLFLEPDVYVNVPLESTYTAAYAGVPRFYRDILEGPTAAS